MQGPDALTSSCMFSKPNDSTAETLTSIIVSSGRISRHAFDHSWKGVIYGWFGGSRLQLSGRVNIFEYRCAIGCFRHHWELEAALWTRLRQHLLLLMQIVGFVCDMGATRAHSDKTRVLQFEVGNDVFHDGATSNRPRLGLLVVGVHVPL